MADAIFTKMVQKCDYGLDLHTATRGRSNILQVRGDMSNNEVRRIARAFGSEIVIDEPGLAGTLRRAATESGIPTITAEIGESQRFEKELVKAGLDGVLNVLYELGMLKGRSVQPRFQVIVKKTEWVRANKGGILEMIAEPRGLVFEGDELCTITNPFGKEVGTVRAPFTGMVVGITNYPMVSPGSPICHLVKLDRTLSTVEAALRREKEAKAKVAMAKVEEKPAGETAKPSAEGASPASAAPPADPSSQVLAPQPVIISPSITRMLEEKAEADDRPLKPEKEASPQKKARKAPAEPAPAARKDEPAESSPNGEREGDVRPSAYYEDYDEDAEPEEKE
jgi:hypothetical protein